MGFYEKVMGQPTIVRAAGTFENSGDNTIVAAPGAGKALVLLYLHVQNESSTGTTVQVKHGAAAVARILLQNQGDGWLREFECPVLMPENTALIVALDGANSHNYTVEYAVIPA